MLAISTPPNQKKFLALLTLPLLFTTEVNAEELLMDEVAVVATGHKRAISETPYAVKFLDEDEDPTAASAQIIC